MNNTQLLFLAQIARHRLMRTEPLADTARWANLDTWRLTELLETKEYAAALDVSRTQFADHIAEHTGNEVTGNTPAERFEASKRFAKDMPIFARSPWDD